VGQKWSSILPATHTHTSVHAHAQPHILVCMHMHNHTYTVSWMSQRVLKVYSQCHFMNCKWEKGNIKIIKLLYFKYL